jgi:putative tricarboxylic transport membrane protein
MDRRFLLVGAALALAAGSFDPAAAEFKPTRPIELVVHGGPGSGNDVFGRALISVLEQEKLSPVRIQIANRVGGGGTTAANYMMSKKGDTNVVAVFTSVWITNPLVQAEAKAALTDMTPLARLVIEPAVFAVKADSPYKSLKDVVDAAKKNPGQIKQSGGSPLARDALVRQLLMANTGANWAFISFPSGGERISALLGGHVDMMIIEPSEAGELIRSGKLRAIAQISDKRLPGFEDVPTLKEAGFDLPNVPQARGIVGPPDMPADAVAFYEDLLQKAAQSPSWQKFVEDNQLEDAFLKSKESREFLTNYEEQLRGVLQQAGVKLAR